MVLEIGKSKINVLADLMSGGVWFLVHRWCLFTVSSHGGWGKGALWDPFYKDPNPIMRAPPSWPHHLPKVPRWRLDYSIWILGRHRCSNYSLPSFLPPTTILYLHHLGHDRSLNNPLWESEGLQSGVPAWQVMKILANSFAVEKLLRREHHYL